MIMGDIMFLFKLRILDLVSIACNIKLIYECVTKCNKQ